MVLKNCQKMYLKVLVFDDACLCIHGKGSPFENIQFLETKKSIPESRAVSFLLVMMFLVIINS